MDSSSQEKEEKEEEEMMLLVDNGKALINMDLIVGVCPHPAGGTIFYGWGENCSVRVEEKFEDILALFNYSEVAPSE